MAGRGRLSGKEKEVVFESLSLGSAEDCGKTSERSRYWNVMRAKSTSVRHAKKCKTKYTVQNVNTINIIEHARDCSKIRTKKQRRFRVSSHRFFMSPPAFSSFKPDPISSNNGVPEQGRPDPVASLSILFRQPDPS